MKKVILQSLVLLFLAALLFGAFLVVRQFLDLPFRPTNDALHEKESPVNLDFLIPEGTYLDDGITIGDVLKIRFNKEASPVEKSIRAVSDLIPPGYRLVANGLLFFAWTFFYMIVFRVLTFMGYTRALRVSLLMAGITYYFMPDFSPGKWDDFLLVGFAVFVICLRAYLVRVKRARSPRET